MLQAQTAPRDVRQGCQHAHLDFYASTGAYVRMCACKCVCIYVDMSIDEWINGGVSV